MASLVRDAGDTEKKSSHLLNDKQRNERPQFATSCKASYQLVKVLNGISSVQTCRGATPK